MTPDCPHTVTKTKKWREGDKEIRRVTCFTCGEDLGTFAGEPGQAAPMPTTLDAFSGESR